MVPLSKCYCQDVTFLKHFILPQFSGWGCVPLKRHYISYPTLTQFSGWNCVPLRRRYTFKPQDLWACAQSLQACPALHPRIQPASLRSPASAGDSLPLAPLGSPGSSDHHIKVKSSGWAWIQYNWCPQKKGKFGHRDRHTHRDADREDSVEPQEGYHWWAQEARREVQNNSLSQSSEGCNPADTWILDVWSGTFL